MKGFLLLLLSVYVVGCASSGDKKSSEKKEKIPESTREAVEEVNESAGSVVDESIILGKSCPVRTNRRTIDFGSREVTSRAYQRLRLSSSSSFRVTGVSTFEKPFDFYNSGEFPGDATFNDYALCSFTEETNDCSLNLEFRPTAVSAYQSRLTVSYVDSRGDNCVVKVLLKGISTESYLGDDNSRGN